MTKTAAEIEQDLDAMVQSHYYSEDYELEWAAKNYFDGLETPQKKIFENVVYRRLSSTPDLSTVTLCARLGLSSLAPLLAGLLREESTTSVLSRAVLHALSRTPGDQAFDAVERFMDSEQAGEALTCLARMNFDRSLHHLRRTMQEDHLHNFCLHVLYERYKKVGKAEFPMDLARLVDPEPKRFVPHLKKIFLSNTGAFNPFEATELEEWMTLLEAL